MIRGICYIIRNSELQIENLLFQFTNLLLLLFNYFCRFQCVLLEAQYFLAESLHAYLYELLSRLIHKSLKLAAPQTIWGIFLGKNVVCGFLYLFQQLSAFFAFQKADFATYTHYFQLQRMNSASNQFHSLILNIPCSRYRLLFHFFRVVFAFYFE